MVRPRGTGNPRGRPRGASGPRIGPAQSVTNKAYKAEYYLTQKQTRERMEAEDTALSGHLRQFAMLPVLGVESRTLPQEGTCLYFS